jgi:Nucleotidyl transferase AbiEii toxin, Type IV TA system
MNITQPPKLPFLEFLGWQIADVYRLTQLEMLDRYERGWQYHHITDLPVSELVFIKQLAIDRKSWLVGELMDFEIGHHQLIYRVLENLNSEFLSECRVYFGGGTLISLDFGEYRTSNDVDFICSFGSDYRKLRNAISDSPGERLRQRTPRILLKDNSDLEITRFTADRYGIRMAIVVDRIPIKTEIIAEARFELDSPRQPSWSPVECLSITDCFTSKLLANADRYADPSVHSRDLIDLAFLRSSQPIPPLAIEKAEAAYRVMSPLTAALTKFQSDADLRFHCYENLAISEAFRSKLIDGIDLLAIDLGLAKTSRTISESGDEIFPFM